MTLLKNIIVVMSSTTSKDIRFCCEKKCLIQPDCQVDGLACRKCESFSYCRCKCETYKKDVIKNNKPILRKIVFYQTRHFITCCPGMCTKVSMDDLTSCCTKCSPIPFSSIQFCNCYLKHCVYGKKSCMLL